MEKKQSIARLIDDLEQDEWRMKVGFSEDVVEAQRVLHDPKTTSERAANAIAKWILESQPCLFGKQAAARDLLSYCVLTNNDLNKPDAAIRDVIQQRRTDWRRAALAGKKHGFIVLAVSERIAMAKPNQAVAKLARALGKLYLLDDNLKMDKIYHEHVFLEYPGRPPRIRMWLGGVNYFSAHGDKRWWNDHRMPGGIGFSVNSVGHMVASNNLANAMGEYQAIVGALLDSTGAMAKIRDLNSAQLFAMRTIANASHGPSGKATELVEDATEVADATTPSDLASRSKSIYRGYYHTDHTLPRVYFRSDVERPSSTKRINLDFTYLTDDAATNPAHQTMAKGVWISGAKKSASVRRFKDAMKATKMRSVEVEPSDYPELAAIMKRPRKKSSASPKKKSGRERA